MRMKAPVAVLISGSGTNLQALIDACADESFPARIALVLSNKADAQGLKRAEKAGIPTQVIAHGGFSTREPFDAALDAAITRSGAHYVCLAGFMRVLSEGFVRKWQGKMINIHPSLLPAFKGLHTHKAALTAGVKIHGCTVHYVAPEMDSGVAIVQAAVPVLPDDTEETLAARVLKAEHAIYPYALKMLASGKVRLEGGQVSKSFQAVQEYTLFNPDIRF